ncbi:MULTISPECIES: RND family transporter [unclassified Mycolicibacterium]|uniref:MMPL/RND family transporter n=1 Tax=unclassified Mycolicibacterium TaxID=2636767 RepID=UPI0012DF4A20|nr:MULTISPECIES: MMPL family transporter [unclassified Mycolicibacterium]MUL82617.1 MMPL family transporter [Mycolicibacterium sp. CBMA 329]MUL88952.1 MMPL family transporter [Mycolicibacterium sp. CBMA 331]MUL97519.1 MMPL family transporter [Mycolicibacterium sp. CBMA 334]MUM26757.1 MMPL family transporter [Mycolicibacterium sp. CBMA 295]MUM38468.1 MMPL family transporter [Mycolicibacterium sp. CBMA 247]
MSNEHRAAEGSVAGSRTARTIRLLAVPIVLLWVAVAALTNTLVPQLEVVGAARSVGLNAPDAPSTQAMRHIGQVFDEFNSDSAAMIVLEGDKPLGDDAHHFYDTLVQRLAQDTKHVEHIQDFWGDPLTAGGSQSKDGKAALVQVYLAGNQGEALSNQSVDAIREIVASVPPPPGVKAYVTGAAPLITDNFEVGSAGTHKVTGITFLVIAVMLLVVYRSLATMLIMLATVLIELAAARGVVAALAHSGVIGLSTYSTNLLTLLAIAAGTDYGIFVVGRYHEARSRGMDREAAYHDMFRGTVHVIVGSGLTIAGAVACLYFTRLPYFQTLGVPAAIGVLVTLAAALTLGPAVLTICSRFGLLEPKRKARARGWRRIGTAIVRWPGPILVVSCAIALIGLLALPGYKTSYDGRPYLPASAPANVGYAAASRHFSEARLNPELLMIETDHDMRNPTDMLVLERVAKAVLHTRGVSLVQSITRPLGTPIKHSSIPFQISAQSASQIMNLGYQQDRAADLLKQANELSNTINILKKQISLQQASADATHEQTQAFHDTVTIVNDLRDKIANFDDQFRPLRNYFYWEPHCFDIPMCAALRSVFDALDGIDKLSDQFGQITASLDKLDALQPQLLALLPPQIAIQERNRDLTLSNYATTSGTNSQSEEALRNATAMGQAFDSAKNDDSFYLPPEAFDNPDFKRGLKLFLSPDGKAARMIITHEGNPATSEGISHIDAIKDSAFDAIKATPLSDAKIYVAGTASAYKDIQDGAKYDLLIAALAAISLILLIMMFITRSLVAAFVIVGTVVLSLGASFGLSVLVWQYIFGVPLYWIVLALAIILLLAVGADYNLLLISRFQEEIGAGLKTGVIRAMTGTGKVVTAAGLVFAATMSSFIFSDLIVLGQIGTTIGLGLLFDTLIVRSFMTPSIAAMMGRWFWWPQIVRPRPASRMLRPYGTRTSVRQLLETEPEQAT